MPGKMLGRRSDAGAAQPSDRSTDEKRNGMRVVAERAQTDDRVGGIRIDIGHGREIQIHPKRGEFVSDETIHRLGDGRIVDRSQRHRAWRRRPYVGEARDAASFLIHGDERREIASGAESADGIGQRAHLLRVLEVAPEQDDAARLAGEILWDVAFARALKAEENQLPGALGDRRLRHKPGYRATGTRTFARLEVGREGWRKIV